MKTRTTDHRMDRPAISPQRVVVATWLGLIGRPIPTVVDRRGADPRDADPRWVGYLFGAVTLHAFAGELSSELRPRGGRTAR